LIACGVHSDDLVVVRSDQEWRPDVILRRGSYRPNICHIGTAGNRTLVLYYQIPLVGSPPGVPVLAADSSYKLAVREPSGWTFGAPGGTAWSATDLASPPAMITTSGNGSASSDQRPNLFVRVPGSDLRTAWSTIWTTFGHRPAWVVGSCWAIESQGVKNDPYRYPDWAVVTFDEPRARPESCV
jgi:hypothetical protein